MKNDRDKKAREELAKKYLQKAVFLRLAKTGDFFATPSNCGEKSVKKLVGKKKIFSLAKTIRFNPQLNSISFRLNDVHRLNVGGLACLGSQQLQQVSLRYSRVACLSLNLSKCFLTAKIKPCMSKYKHFYTVKLRTAHYISYYLFDG